MTDHLKEGAPSPMKVNAEAASRERSICGFRHRLLKKEDGVPASVTRLRTDHAQAHWHKHTHEYYYILDGEGTLRIDGEDIVVKSGDCVWIPPGHIHQALGEFEALIIGIPPFDYDDVLMAPSDSSDQTA